MIDSFFLIAAGFSALILIFFAAGAAVSFLPALAIYCGELWIAVFRWMLRAMGVVILFTIFICCILIIGPL
jgi:hypothetical protein